MEMCGFTERIYHSLSSKKGGSSVWVGIIQSLDLDILSVLREISIILGRSHPRQEGEAVL